MDMFSVPEGGKDITVDNLCFKYTGAHGISTVGENENIVITNCEIGWIGGSWNNSVRYGNGIQFWSNVKNCRVENNWIYQCYDAGVTFQSATYSEYDNLRFSNNLIEFCSYNFEFFTGKSTEGKYGPTTNIYIENNIMRFAGYGWGVQRPDAHSVAHINNWKHCYNDLSNFCIKNNIFDCSDNYIICWYDSTAPQEGVVVSGNSYYQKANASNRVLNFSNKGEKKATNQKQLEEAVAVFDPSPKTVKWLEK